MIDAVVRHLHGSLVPFRLTSRPSAEALPHSAYRLPPGGMLVETRVLRVGRSPVLVCYPNGERPDHAALRNLLGELVVEGSKKELPDLLRDAGEDVPPLGKLFGVPLIVDTRVSEARVLVFRAFGEDFFEVAYEDLARLETPRVGTFAFAGELGSRRAEEAQPGR